MKCRQYIFKLTSGQLDEAGLAERLDATRHRWSCRHCRAFTRNDAQLARILADYQAHLTTPVDEPPSADGA
ncbi:MAG: hypothetical protein QM742_17615 [Aquabacterium sp.]